MIPTAVQARRVALLCLIAQQGEKKRAEARALVLTSRPRHGTEVEVLMSHSRGLWALVPVKDMRDAKQRLSPVLDAAERRELFRAMLEDVLGALAGVGGLAGVLLVTRDADALSLAERHGARVLHESENRGHTRASTLGAQALARDGASGMLQLPGDLPLLTPDDVAAVLAAHGEAPAITLAPSHDGRGSNAVASSPPDLLPLGFGDDSFAPHVARARGLGVEPAVVRRDGIGLDVDGPDDLRRFLAAPSATHAYAYLVASGIAARLGDDQP